MNHRSLAVSRIPGVFSVCRLAPGSQLPSWAMRGAFFCAASTPDELSIVSLADEVPLDTQHESGWVCFKLEGPLPV